MPSISPSEEKIRQRLTLASRQPIDNPYPESFFNGPPRPASVLLPFIQREGSWWLLFIRRTLGINDRHGGQVAFPGGRADEEDQDPAVTALRETQEEIGVDPRSVALLGQLNPIRTITNYLVTPVIGVIPWPYPFRLSPMEVSRAFTIPLNWLADPANREVHERDLPPPYHKISVIYFSHYDGELLWGASARIMVNLISALFPPSP